MCEAARKLYRGEICIRF